MRRTEPTDTYDAYGDSKLWAQEIPPHCASIPVTAAICLRCPTRILDDTLIVCMKVDLQQESSTDHEGLAAVLFTDGSAGRAGRRTSGSGPLGVSDRCRRAPKSQRRNQFRVVSWDRCTGTSTAVVPCCPNRKCRDSGLACRRLLVSPTHGTGSLLSAVSLRSDRRHKILVLCSRQRKP